MNDMTTPPANDLTTPPAATAPGDKRLALMIDLERCTGCKSCEAACKQENQLGPLEHRNKVVWLGDTGAPDLANATATGSPT